MDSSESRQGEPIEILRCDWLSEWDRYPHRSRPGSRVVSRKKSFPISQGRLIKVNTKSF